MPLLAIKMESPAGVLRTEPKTWSGEAAAFCPKCKGLQTVWINENMLMPTRKYYQAGRYIYHECGADQPCRLYYSW